jgi:hypothetical protein
MQRLDRLDQPVHQLLLLLVELVVVVGLGLQRRFRFF